MLTGSKVKSCLRSYLKLYRQVFIKQRIMQNRQEGGQGRPLCYWVQLNAQSFKTYYDRLVTLCMELHPDLIAIIAGQFEQHHRFRIHTF